MSSFPRREIIFLLLSGLILLGLILLEDLALPAPLSALRMVLGIAAVLIVPGYALQAALFPSAGDLDLPSRLALSFGLSIAALPVIAMSLYLSALPMQGWMILGSLIVLMLVCAVILIIRRRRIPYETPYPEAHIGLRVWWQGQDRLSRGLYLLLAGAVCAAAIITLAHIWSETTGRYTEFYLLEPGTDAADAPSTAEAGNPVTVRYGIMNREGEPSTYRIVVEQNGEQTLMVVGPILIPDGEAREDSFALSVPPAADSQRIDLLLDRSGSVWPYRRLSFWLNGIGAAGGMTTP